MFILQAGASKTDKAKKIGTKFLTEDEFLQLIVDKSANKKPLKVRIVRYLPIQNTPVTREGKTLIFILLKAKLKLKKNKCNSATFNTYLL